MACFVINCTKQQANQEACAQVVFQLLFFKLGEFLILFYFCQCLLAGIQNCKIEFMAPTCQTGYQNTVNFEYRK